jgi:hypothetical protein
LEDGDRLQNLYLRNNTLWTLDTIHSRVLTYTDTLRNPPVLDSPDDEASHLPTHYTTLAWQTLQGALSYQWQIATNPDFLAPLDKFEGLSTVPNIRLPALDTQTTYYWRIRIGSPILSPWSETRSFSTATSSEISAPTLIEPKSNSLTSRQPLFRWSTSEGAEGYELQVSPGDNFTPLVIDKSGDYACIANLWASDVSLEYDTPCYWRVRAINNLGSSQWSSVGIFTPKLDTPKLITPGTGYSSITPNFTWNASDGAEGYELLISRNDDFSDLIINNTGNNSCHTNAWSGVTLEYKTSYLWKVRAYSGVHFSDWSETGIFTTKPESSSGSSGGGGATTSKPLPTPTPTPSQTPTTPAPTTVKTSTVAATSTATNVKTTTLDPTVTTVASTSPQALTDTPTPSASPPPDDSLDSIIRLVFWLVGGLVILTVILLVVVLAVLKKFKKY